MKKIFSIIIIIMIISVLVLNFNITKKLNINIDLSKAKDSIVLSSFNDDYKIVIKESDFDDDSLRALASKTTYLLLGTKNETKEDYYLRHQDYLKLKYSFDEDNDIPDISVPGMFLSLNELNVNYTTIGNIKMTTSKDYYICQVTLPKITINEEDTNNPKKFKEITTNMIITYIYKKYKEKYYLYYLDAYTKTDISNYDDTTYAIKSDLSINSLFNTNKLNTVNNTIINKVYSNNKNNIVYLTSYNTNTFISSSIGVILKDGIILTNYDFINKSLKEASYISIIINNKYYELDGIITMDIKSNLAILKLKDKVKTNINIGNTPNVEDAVISIDENNNKNKTLVISNTSYIETINNDNSSSLLFDTSSNLIGISNKNNESIHNVYITPKTLTNIMNKFNNINFNDIDTISFDKLKESYYTKSKYKEKNITIPNKIINKYKIIKTINNNIYIPLVKYSKINNNITLRYKNNINKYISNIDMSNSLREELLSSNYNETFNSENKIILENKKYKIVFLSEFDYLIVLVVVK